MPDQDKCPECGADKDPQGGEWFACRSLYSYTANERELIQSDFCRIRQLEQANADLRKQLAARPIITEREADQMARRIAHGAIPYCTRNDQQECEAARRAARAVLMELVDRPSKEPKT